MNKNIVHVIPTLEVGGAETMLLQLIRSLGSQPFTHTIVTLQKAGRLGPAFEKLGARLVELGMPAGLPNMPGLTDVLRRTFDKAPDLLHGWRYHGNLIAQTMRTVVPPPDPPVLWSIHSAQPQAEGPELANEQMQKANAMLSVVANGIVYTSATNMAAHEARDYASARAQVLPSGVDLDAFKPNREAAYRLRTRLSVPPETKLIGFVAPLRLQKDPVVFFDAVQASADLDVHFVAVGLRNDAMPKPYKTSIPKDIQSRVHFLGVETDMPSVLAGLDILTRSSRLEAMSRTVLEAMACETLCVCVDSGENAVMLKDVGWVTPPGDAQALLQGWKQALACAPGEAATRRTRGRERIQAQFSAPAMAQAFAELYHDLTAVRP